jgi:hypothetical protein
MSGTEEGLPEGGASERSGKGAEQVSMDWERILTQYVYEKGYWRERREGDAKDEMTSSGGTPEGFHRVLVELGLVRDDR